MLLLKQSRRLFPTCIGILISCSAIMDAGEVEDLLYKGRLELTNDNPTAAILYFSKALEQCQPGIDAYAVRFARCNFFMGEGYFQKFKVQPNRADGETAIKYFEIAVKVGEGVTPRYVADGQMRILQLRQALARMETGISETGGEFRVRSLVKGIIPSRRWQIYVGEQRLDTPFIDVFALLDKSGEISNEKQSAVYISVPTAVGVCEYLGMQLSSGKVTEGYGQDSVLNMTELFRKPGYPELALKNGEKWNGYWAIVDYDLMFAVPVTLFEQFGATVNIDWDGKKVIITTNLPSKKIIDWFEMTDALLLLPQGAEGDWIIGFHEFQMPEKIYPGQLVKGRVSIRIKDNARQSSGAVMYMSLFGDWIPDMELTRIYAGLVGEPRLLSIPFSFTAPSKPGTYHLRCPMVLALAPVKNYFGSKPIGQNDPGVGPYTEVSFSVSELQATTPVQSQVEDNEPVETARRLLNSVYSKNMNTMTDLLSEEVWTFGLKGLRKGKDAFLDYVLSTTSSGPVEIVSILKKQELEEGKICLVEAITKLPEKEPSTLLLWFEKTKGKWLLITPSLQMAGYSDIQVQAALSSFASTWANRGGDTFFNCRARIAVPNTYNFTYSLWMEIEYEYTHKSDSGTVSGRRTSDVIMNHKGNSWEYGFIVHH